ncbi:MAG: hypothetical protein KKG09_11235 [Verrucomicrobia bacterium]|nr:hypothetical protein [Verrucomicrobiota bacterium]MCG2680721.1 hypothetical protein [Kiritimatiellia bacterium]
MNLRILALVALTNPLLVPNAASAEEGNSMQLHTSNILSIKAVEEHVLIPGGSHKGLWLGPSLLFKPGTPPNTFHVFFAVSDRTGGDSIQRNMHFTASRHPEDAAAFSAWHRAWKVEDYPESLRERTDAQGFRFVPTFSWKFHPASGKVIAFGHVLRHRGEKLSDHLEHCAISYCVHDPSNGSFAPWKSFRIKIDG